MNAVYVILLNVFNDFISVGILKMENSATHGKISTPAIGIRLDERYIAPPPHIET